MPALPGNHTLTIHQGDEFDRTITYEDANNSAVDLTGYDAEFVIRRQPNGAQIAFLNNDAGGITLGGSAGTIRRGPSC